MADSISKCLFRNLKSYFKKNDLSDRVLKIIELHDHQRRKRKLSVGHLADTDTEVLASCLKKNSKTQKDGQKHRQKNSDWAGKEKDLLTVENNVKHEDEENIKHINKEKSANNLCENRCIVTEMIKSEPQEQDSNSSGLPIKAVMPLIVSIDLTILNFDTVSCLLVTSNTDVKHKDEENIKHINKEKSANNLCENGCIVTEMIKSDPLEQDSNSSDLPIKEFERMYAAFPVHSIVLCLHSEFFQKMLTTSGTREASSTIIELKVPVGDGKFVEMLISAFYDEKSLHKMNSIEDVLKFMDIAERYCCTSFIEKGLFMINNLEIFTIENCNIIIERCCHLKRFFNNLDNPVDKLSTRVSLFKKIEQQCIEFMEVEFSPLECTLKNTLRLSFGSLYILLRDVSRLAFSEDTVFLMLYEWLRLHDPEYTDSAHIQKLLSCIRYQYCSRFFLTERLSLSDEILSKCESYSEWLLTAVSYHTFDEETRIGRGYPPTKIQSRNINDANRGNEYIFTLDFDEENMKFDYAESYFVNAGYIYGVDIKAKITGSLVSYNVGIYAKPPFHRNNKENGDNLIHETITLGYALLRGSVFYDEIIFCGEKFQRMKRYFQKFSVTLNRFSYAVRLPTIYADLPFHENAKLEGIQLALIIGSSEKILDRLQEIQHTSYRSRIILHADDFS